MPAVDAVPVIAVSTLVHWVNGASVTYERVAVTDHEVTRHEHAVRLGQIEDIDQKLGALEIGRASCRERV